MTTLTTLTSTHDVAVRHPALGSSTASAARVARSPWVAVLTAGAVGAAAAVGTAMALASTLTVNLPLA